MNMMTAILAHEPVLSRAETAAIVAAAARTVSPLWPLESAIAVNPLSGFEHLPFEQALATGAHLFDAGRNLPLPVWRKLYAARKLGEPELRDAAIARLGGVYQAMAVVAPGVNALDLMMARLLETAAAPHPAPGTLAPDAAFIAKWCAAFLDQGLATTAMPHRELGLYPAVLALAAHDPAFAALTGKAGARLLLAVPRDPLEAIAQGLAALAVEPGTEQARCAALIARLPGWAGHLRWRGEHADPDHAAGAPATMADLVALWLLIERAGALTPPAAPAPAPDLTGELAARFALHGAALDEALARPDSQFRRIARMDDAELGQVFMNAAEWTYANTVVPRLQAAAIRPPAFGPADAQLVFCIDVRSEPFRRRLEEQGAYETLGYAGFFGLPIALRRVGEGRRRKLLPVLLSPSHDLAETPLPGREAEADAMTLAERQTNQRAALLAAAKQGAATAFAAAEATGPVAGLAMALRTLAPRLVGQVGAALRAERAEALSCSSHGFTLAEKIGMSAALFSLTGLSTNTARLVVLLGHGGSTVNNPYAAALDCGACGGHAGGANARLLAGILNEPAVRQGLSARGLVLPAETVFIAGEHDTTIDLVTLFDADQIPASHASDLVRLEAALARAGQANRAHRAGLLGRAPEDLITGAIHWGEVRPEWGLAGNAGFIVGPRWLSRHVDLEGRAFLHSYDWQADPDGTALATILTAPMVVAQWINCQYLFSTIDNRRYGAGDKVTHNVVGGIGVVQGNGGDLQVGLPRQSLFADDGTPYHVPQRLLAIVHAPLDRVAAIVESHDILGRLFGNGWVALVVIDPVTGRAHRWQADTVRQAEGASPHAI